MAGVFFWLWEPLAVSLVETGEEMDGYWLGMKINTEENMNRFCIMRSLIRSDDSVWIENIHYVQQKWSISYFTQEKINQLCLDGSDAKTNGELHCICNSILRREYQRYADGLRINVWGEVLNRQCFQLADCSQLQYAVLLNLSSDKKLVSVEDL